MSWLRQEGQQVDNAIGSAGSHTDLPLFGFMPFAAPAAFQDLFTLALGHHSLHLQQQLILGGVGNGAIDEDDLHPQAMKVLNEHELMSMVAGEAVRRQHEHLIDRTQHGPIPQGIQARSGQGGPTKAVVEKDHVGIDGIAVVIALGLQTGQLGIDGAFLNLTITGHSGVEGDVLWHLISPRLDGVPWSQSVGR
jgi:hypothetical protein